MNNDIRNIFQNVVTSENLMTELFRNLLSYKIFRDYFLRLFLDENSLKLIDSNDINTQYSIPNGRPDLVIINNKFQIYFEIKIGDTELTSNQPDEYINDLKKATNKEKWMVFLTPKNYYRLDWLKSKGFDEVSRCIHDFKINTKIIFWQDVMDIIEDNSLNCLNHSFNDFLGLMKIWYELETINFESSEIELMFGKNITNADANNINFNSEEYEIMTTTNAIPIIIHKLYKLIDEVGNSATKKAGGKVYKDKNEYGIYFKDKDGNDILWFGVWYEAWEKLKKPICFGVHHEWSETIIKEFKHLYPKSVDISDWYIYWIEKESLLYNAVEKTEEIIEKTLTILNQ